MPESDQLITFKERLQQVEQRLSSAARIVGRDPQSIHLIGVTKTATVEQIKTAHQAGMRHFGENRWQSAGPKLEALRDLVDIEWHFIGHLQTNKAKKVVAHFDWIHSIDSLKLWRKISTYAQKLNKSPKLLLEVNIAGETQKHGLAPGQIKEVIAQAQKEGLIPIIGLMTILPWFKDQDKALPYFKLLRKLADQFDLPHCSMGMTDDFEAAIKAGATILRLGRILFPLVSD